MAGMTACLWQMHPEASNMEIFQAVEQSAHLYNTPNDSMGYGIPDFWEAHLILEEISGIQNNLAESDFTVFPNPTTDDITLALDAFISEELVIDVYSSSGALVIKKRANILLDNAQYSLKTRGLSKGIYTIVLRHSKGQSRIQFVKK